MVLSPALAVNLLHKLPMTKILASHDLELVQALCQRVIVFDGGRVVADDSANHILSDISLLATHGLVEDRKRRRG